MKPTRTIALVIAVTLGCLLSPGPVAPAGDPPTVLCEDGCDHSCRRCGSVCRPVPTTRTVSKHCWRVEWKKVCIPAVQPPWARWWRKACDHEDACDGTCDEPRCGRVRWVRVLVKEKYECTKCGCEWVIEPGCDDCLSEVGTPSKVSNGSPAQSGQGGIARVGLTSQD